MIHSGACLDVTPFQPGPTSFSSVTLWQPWHLTPYTLFPLSAIAAIQRCSQVYFCEFAFAADGDHTTGYHFLHFRFVVCTGVPELVLPSPHEKAKKVMEAIKLMMINFFIFFILR
jgi:hypothetical protein